MKRTNESFDPAPAMARYRDLTHDEVGELLGVSRATVVAWRSGRRRFTAKRADEIAIHQLGLHPLLLWPNWGNRRDRGRGAT